jgi:hypothetical protein
MPALLLLPVFGTSSPAQAQMGAFCQVPLDIGSLPPTEISGGSKKAPAWPSLGRHSALLTISHGLLVKNE